MHPFEVALPGSSPRHPSLPGIHQISYMKRLCTKRQPSADEVSIALHIDIVVNRPVKFESSKVRPNMKIILHPASASSLPGRSQITHSKHIAVD
jgi:hypothetical protein